MNEIFRKVVSPILVLFLLAFLLVVIKVFAVSGSELLQKDPKAMDFLAFYTGASLLTQGSEHLYAVGVQQLLQQQIAPITKELDIFLPFLNPPFVAFVFSPFILLPLVPAYILWTASNVLLFVWFSIVASKQVSHVKWYVKTAVILGIATFIPVATSLLLGQLTFVLLIILLFSWIVLKRGSQFRGGMLLSVLLLKPHFFILPMLAILVQRRKRIIFGMLTGASVLAAVSLVLVGWDGVVAYVSLLTAVANWDKGYGVDIKAQHSLQTALLILTGAQSIADIRSVWAIGTVSIITAALFIWSRQYTFSSPQFSLQFVLLILTSLIVSPHTHFHDLALLTVVGVMIISLLTKIKKYKKLFVCLLIAEYLCMLVGFLSLIYMPQSQYIWVVVSVVLLLTFWGFLFRVLLAKKLK